MKHHPFSKRKAELVLLTVFLLLLPAIPLGTAQPEHNTVSDPAAAGTLDWWPMPRYDTANTADSQSTVPMPWEIYWQYQTYDIAAGPSPVAADGKLFVITSGYNKERPLENRTLARVICMNADSGVVLWEHVLPGFACYTPAYYQGKVYAISIDTELAATLFCIDAAAGGEVWSRTVQYYTACPVVADGIVYVASTDTYWTTGSIQAFDATTGHPEWTYTAPDEVISVMPAVLDGNLYCVKVVGSECLSFCLNAATGSLVWENYLWTDPSFFPYSIVAEANFLVVGGADESSYEGEILGLERSGGDVVWDTPIGEWYSQWPDMIPYLAVGDDRVFYAALGLDVSSSIGCLDIASGYPFWTDSIMENVFSSPILADGKLLFHSMAKFHCYDAASGQELDYMAFYGGPSSPIVANDMIYCIDLNGFVYGFGVETDPQAPTITGEAQGKIKHEYEYTISATDPANDDLYYYVDWGDGTFTDWVGPSHSGDAITVNHTWTEKGDYTIKARAKDTHNVESTWGFLTVTMPLRDPRPTLLGWLLDRFPHAFPLLRLLSKQ